MVKRPACLGEKIMPSQKAGSHRWERRWRTHSAMTPRAFAEALFWCTAVLKERQRKKKRTAEAAQESFWFLQAKVASRDSAAKRLPKWGHFHALGVPGHEPLRNPNDPVWFANKTWKRKLSQRGRNSFRQEWGGETLARSLSFGCFMTAICLFHLSFISCTFLELWLSHWRAANVRKILEY